jgi:hypothetical protein
MPTRVMPCGVHNEGDFFIQRRKFAPTKVQTHDLWRVALLSQTNHVDVAIPRVASCESTTRSRSKPTPSAAIGNVKLPRKTVILTKLLLLNNAFFISIFSFFHVHPLSM